MSTVSLIGFDACLMGMTEVAYELRNSADVMVASESNIPAQGWDFYAFLSNLKANPTLSAAGLGSSIVDAYRDRYALTPETTLSAVRPADVAALARAIDEFAAVMIDSGQDSDWEAVQAARDDAQFYNQDLSNWLYEDYRDLGDFMTHVCWSESVSGEIASAAAGVIAALHSAVICQYASSDVAIGSNGLTIYLPGLFEPADQKPYPAEYAPLDFFEDTRWPAFVARLRQANTTVSVSASPDPLVYGQEVTLTATVSSAWLNHTPTGTVNFLTWSGWPLGTGELQADGTATFTTSQLYSGEFIVASYAGDADFAPSATGWLQFAVQPAQTSTVVTSSVNPLICGDTVSFTAAVRRDSRAISRQLDSSGSWTMGLGWCGAGWTRTARPPSTR